jgi:hypothetical protein
VDSSGFDERTLYVMTNVSIFTAYLPASLSFATIVRRFEQGWTLLAGDVGAESNEVMPLATYYAIFGPSGLNKS